MRSRPNRQLSWSTAVIMPEGSEVAEARDAANVRLLASTQCRFMAYSVEKLGDGRGGVSTQRNPDVATVNIFYLDVRMPDERGECALFGEVSDQ